MHRSHLFTKVGNSGGGFLPLSDRDTAIQTDIALQAAVCECKAASLQLLSGEEQSEEETC